MRKRIKALDDKVLSCKLALPVACAAIRAEAVKKKRLSREADSGIYTGFGIARVLLRPPLQQC